MTPIADIKQRIAITDLVAAAGLTVTGRGRIRTTAEHDSLKLWTETNTWFWFSKGVGGDVLDWYQHIHRCDFRQALQDLARQAGVQLRPLPPQEQEAEDHRRAHQRILAIAAHHYHRLIQHPGAAAARAYCHRRGWDDATISREMIGYFPSDKATLSSDSTPLASRLRDEGLLDHPTARAVLSVPPDMIVYTHRRGGIVTYLTARSIEGRRHYALPEDVGPKQLYHNHPAGRPLNDRPILVEGPADAIALGQLGFRAVALCGVHGQLPNGIGWVALDNDATGQARSLDIALAIGPLTRIVSWDHGSDAAEAVRNGATADDIRAALANSTTAILALAQEAGQARGEERTALLRTFFQHYLRLEEEDSIAATDIKPDLAARLGVGIAQFNRLRKAQLAQVQEDGDESPDRYEYSAGGATAGYVWEQCVSWDATGRPRSLYAVRNPDGAIEMRTSLDINGITYLPFPGDMGLIHKKVVLFPDHPQEYGSHKRLVADVQAFIHRYLDIDRFYEKLAAYYVVFSWLYDLFETLPYLRALGDYGTGKTRFLQTIGSICYRPMLVSGASTVSPIFRIIDMFRGTLIIDEADFGQSDVDAEIIKILNVGYYKGGVVLRAEKDPNGQDGDYWPAAKDVYGPKILATRKLFDDRATESRCLTKRMSTAKPRPDIPYILGEEFWSQAQAIRNKLLMYRLRNHRPIVVDQALADESIEPRLNQVTMALKSTVDDPDMLAEISAFVRAYNELLISDRQMTLPAIVVQALANIYYSDKQDLLGDARDFSMKGIHDAAREILVDIDPDAKISPKRIGQVLTEDLGLSRRGTDPATRRRIVLFEEEELTSLMSRYGIEKPLRR